MRIENVFRALSEGKIVKHGNICFRVNEHRLESKYGNGSWETITELLNDPDWIGTTEEYNQMIKSEEH